MGERLVSVGLDVGTTSTQLIVSALTVENRASGFAVPDLQITDRRVVYESPVYLTPLVSENLVDGEKIREMVLCEYEKAGISRETVDTGAVIITGETSRKENARAVLEALSDFAGDFVVATAGPDLESILAARGAGAVDYSGQTGKTVLHMDIGGGTSNLALIEDGVITATGCLNVGGRLVKVNREREITYVSPVLAGLCELRPGQKADPSCLEPVAEQLARCLEMAAGLTAPGPILEQLTTREGGGRPFPWKKPEMISFSGGVADCIGQETDWAAFGDMGPLLGRAIFRSRLCGGAYRLGRETIRATVIGAGCHSAALSGSTVFYRRMDFPVKNLPVAVLPGSEIPGAEDIRQALSLCGEEMAVLSLPGLPVPSYDRIRELARAIARGFGSRPVAVALEQDMARALGQALALLLPADRPILCIDSIRLTADTFLDVGAPVGPALPVVMKTLILKQ